jgi:hypothetical protein
LQIASYHVLNHGDSRIPKSLNAINQKEYIAVAFEQSVVVLHTLSFKVELYYGDDLTLVVNERSLLHHEEEVAAAANSDVIDQGASSKLSDQSRHGDKVVVDYGEDGMSSMIAMMRVSCDHPILLFN